jgi:hypothetical protein
MPGEPEKGLSWKRPLLSSWTEFQEALIPTDKFAEWYGHDGQFVSRPNMGMITGRASDNLMVIDLDLYKNLGAREWWDRLVELEYNNMDFETVEQRTGGGGVQKIYRAPPGWTVPNKSILSMGIDIKGQGGFAMLPPSLHESGKCYEWVEGKSPDDIPVTMAPDWLLEAVEKLVAEHGGGTGTSRRGNGQSQQGAYDAFGHQTDGREGRMSTLIWAAICDWYRERYVMGRDEIPTEAESLTREQEKYAVYAGLIGPKLDENGIPENRGPEMFHVKWRTDMRKWHGKVRDAALKRPPPKNDGQGPDLSDEFAKDETQAKPAGAQIYPSLNFDQIMEAPDPVWAIEDLINERSLGFVFGPPGSLKTFIALDLALSIVTKQATWWGRKVNQHGAVVYLCREGTSSLKFRLKAWERHRQVSGKGCQFHLIEKTINFMELTDIVVLISTVEDIMTRAGMPVTTVFVDTVSRVLPGAKENQQEDMSLFIAACDMLQQRFGCVVVGVHHTNKNGTIRGSTVIPAAGDFLIETRREPGAMTGSIVIQKVKDGEDGQEFPFKVTKIDLGGIVPRSSLAVDPSDEPLKQLETGPEWPDLAICREILAEIDQQWWKGAPWCHATNSSRSAMSIIMNRWQLKRAVVKDMLAKWTATGVIEEVERDAKTHVKGYKKLANI